MKKTLILFSFLGFSFLNAEISKQIYPEPIPVIERCYTLSYDARTRNANWVYERITAESVVGKEERENCRFKEDSSIPKIFRATLSDYSKSGYDRGHLAPAANHKNNYKDLQETFFLSNMSPQDPQFNRGYWAKLEKLVRDLTKEYHYLEVFTGPLYLPKQEADGRKYVKYEVIGENNVAVPTHFFKIIKCKSKKGTSETLAYILPNEKILAETPLSKFKTTIQQVERVAGIIFSN